MSPQQVPCSSSERQITRFKHQKLLSPSCLAKSAAPSLQVMRVMFSSLFGNERIKEVRALINQLPDQSVPFTFYQTPLFYTAT